VALVRAPWLKNTTVHASTEIAFRTPAGTRLTGWLTLPSTPKITPPPLLIYCQGGLWDSEASVFSREAQILADLGVAVMKVNHRGTAGRGRTHLNAVLEGIDEVPLEDVLASIDWIAARYRIDRSRLIVMGEGFGGYLARRALELHNDIFRCAISINGPTNLSAWAGWRPAAAGNSMHRTGGIEASPPIDFTSLVRGAFIGKAKRTESPVVASLNRKALLVVESSDSLDTTPLSSFLAGFGLGSTGSSIEHLRIEGPFTNGSAVNRERVFRRIEEFLNFNLYDFEARIGPMRVLE
jgi:poly(3-hydroxybutyrate) depolymerase